MSNVARQIIGYADQIRANNPGTYGMKGAAPGTSGYVRGGWRAAVEAATQEYYRKKGSGPSAATIRRKQLGTVAHRLKADPEKDALYRGYRRQLEELKSRYWNAGLDIRAVRPAQPKRDRSGVPRPRKRLAPILL